MSVVEEQEKSKKPTGCHAYALRQRSVMEITGVTDVISFDEKLVVLQTDMGEMSVEGEGLRVGTLDVDRGEVKLGGRVNGVNYYDSGESPQEKKGILRKLFR